jgi:hypothetical protein
MITGKTTNSNPVGVYVPYDAVFSDGPMTFDYFKKVVKSLSRTDTLFWCARLNLIIADPQVDGKNKQQHCLDYFFEPQQVQVLNNYIKERESSAKVGVVNRGTLLELIRWACLLSSDHPDDGETFNKHEVRNAFAQVLLMASEFWGQRMYPGDIFGKGDTIEEKRRNALPITRRVMMETSIHPRPFEALVRGRTLFKDFMPLHYSGFDSAFHDATGISIDNYYDCASMFLSHCINTEAKSGVGSKTESGIFTFAACVKAAPHMERQFKAYFNLQSCTTDGVRDGIWEKATEPDVFVHTYNLKPLRERPILAASGDRWIIVDPLLYVEQQSIGPLFQLMRNRFKQDANALTEAFGHSFEDYVGSILQRIYPHSGSHLAKRLYCDARDEADSSIQIADFALDDISDLVLIETKTAFIPDDKVDACCVESYLNCLQQRYYENAGSKKGYGQLARSVQMLSSGEWKPADMDISQAKRIFPVLLIHDDLLDAPLHCWYFANKFRTALDPDTVESGEWMVKGRFRVAPLVVMTIDDLECLESSLSGFTLVDLLKAYSTATPDRLVSLNNFLAANSEQFPLYRNKSLASGCETILNECMRRVFPTRANISIVEGVAAKGV